MALVFPDQLPQVYGDRLAGLMAEWLERPENGRQVGQCHEMMQKLLNGTITPYQFEEYSFCSLNFWNRDFVRLLRAGLPYIRYKMIRCGLRIHGLNPPPEYSLYLPAYQPTSTDRSCNRAVANEARRITQQQQQQWQQQQRSQSVNGNPAYSGSTSSSQAIVAPGRKPRSPLVSFDYPYSKVSYRCALCDEPFKGLAVNAAPNKDDWLNMHITHGPTATNCMRAICGNVQLGSRSADALVKAGLLKVKLHCSLCENTEFDAGNRDQHVALTHKELLRPMEYAEQPGVGYGSQLGTFQRNAPISAQLSQTSSYPIQPYISHGRSYPMVDLTSDNSTSGGRAVVPSAGRDYYQTDVAWTSTNRSNSNYTSNVIQQQPYTRDVPYNWNPTGNGPTSTTPSGSQPNNYADPHQAPPQFATGTTNAMSMRHDVATDPQSQNPLLMDLLTRPTLPESLYRQTDGELAVGWSQQQGSVAPNYHLATDSQGRHLTARQSQSPYSDPFSSPPVFEDISPEQSPERENPPFNTSSSAGPPTRLEVQPEPLRFYPSALPKSTAITNSSATVSEAWPHADLPSQSVTAQNWVQLADKAVSARSQTTSGAVSEASPEKTQNPVDLSAKRSEDVADAVKKYYPIISQACGQDTSLHDIHTDQAVSQSADQPQPSTIPTNGSLAVPAAPSTEIVPESPATRLLSLSPLPLRIVTSPVSPASPRDATTSSNSKLAEICVPDRLGQEQSGCDENPVKMEFCDDLAGSPSEEALSAGKRKIYIDYEDFVLPLFVQGKKIKIEPEEEDKPVTVKQKEMEENSEVFVCSACCLVFNDLDDHSKHGKRHVLASCLGRKDKAFHCFLPSCGYLAVDEKDFGRHQARHIIIDQVMCMKKADNWLELIGLESDCPMRS